MENVIGGCTVDGRCHTSSHGFIRKSIEKTAINLLQRNGTEIPFFGRKIECVQIEKSQK